MSRKIIAWFFSFILLGASQMVFAQTGDLFSVTSSGTLGAVQVRLCLNGRGPTSCENHDVTNHTLSVLTTIAGRSYSQVGIKSVTPGYSFTGCTLISNGYCIFTASDTSAGSVTITSTTGAAILSSLNPTSGSASGGTGITLTGTNLTGATGVTFGGTAATAVNVVNTTTVTAVTPAHATGAVDVVITTSGGSSTLPSSYTYNTTAIGQSSGGGVIACLNGGVNNLIVASADNSTGLQWGAGTATSATSTTDGAANTATIVASYGAGTTYAAGLCDAYAVDSQGNTPCQSGNTCYSDWFLAADTQTNCLFTNRAAIGGFASSQYWTSTERDATTAWEYNFSNSTVGYTLKSVVFHVRCVRAFAP